MWPIFPTKVFFYWSQGGSHGPSLEAPRVGVATPGPKVPDIFKYMIHSTINLPIKLKKFPQKVIKAHTLTYEALSCKDLERLTDPLKRAFLESISYKLRSTPWGTLAEDRTRRRCGRSWTRASASWARQKAWTRFCGRPSSPCRNLTLPRFKVEVSTADSAGTVPETTWRRGTNSVIRVKCYK